MKERESLSGSGRIYVNAVKRYMESEGYFLESDAFSSGERVDLVYKRPKLDNDWLTIVECKNTSTSPLRKPFAKQILGYLAYNLLYPSRNCFFFIFIRKMVNDDAWEELFGENYSRKNVDDYLNRFLPSLVETKKDLRIKSIIEQNLRKEMVYRFFEKTKVVEANAEILHEIAKDTLGDHPSFIEKYAVEMNDKWMQRTNLQKEKCKLIVNLFPISLPKYIYGAPSSISLDEMIESLGGSWRPPYHSHSQRIFTFAKFNEENPLSNFIQPDLIIRYASLAFLETEERMNILQRLLNSWLNNLGRSKGLMRDDRRRFYFISTFISQNRISKRAIPWSKNPAGKEVVRPYYKAEELNFVFHRACLIRTEFLDGVPHVKLLPMKLFSSNGRDLLDSESIRSIEHTFRKPTMSYNQNLVNELEFWKEIFFNPTSILLLHNIPSYIFPSPRIKEYGIYSPFTPKKSKDSERIPLKSLEEFL